MLVFVVTKHRFVLFVSPKCGFGTTRSSVYKIPGLPTSKIPVRTMASAMDVEGIENFTWILVCRDPLRRLVSSYFMPEVEQDVTFRDFVQRMHEYTSIHQKLQCEGPAHKLIDAFPEKKFEHIVSTEELDTLPAILAEISETVVRKTFGRSDHAHKREITPDDGTCVADVVKSDHPNPNPKIERFFDAALLELAKERVGKDTEFFARYGVVWPPLKMQE